MEKVPLRVDLASIEANIEQIEIAATKIKDILSRLISSSDKSFEVIYRDQHFDFFYPSTLQEQEDLAQQREYLINALLSDCLVDMIENPYDSDPNKQLWRYIKLFASGADPLDYQIEKFDLKDLYPVHDDQGELVTALPLQEDSYYIEQERQDVGQDQEVDSGF